MLRNFFALLSFVLICNSRIDASIIIDIESSELQQLGEIFVQSYIEQRVILSTRRLQLKF